MEIQVTWNKPNAAPQSVTVGVNANDPHKDDEELQLTKAVAAARTLFNQRLGEYPPADQISASITKK